MAESNGENEEDTGLGIQIGVENGDVIVLFSQTLSTLGLPPDSAEKLGNALLHHASEARRLTET